jgi:glycosyltransferase involved in cell wall biosynthesis
MVISRVLGLEHLHWAELMQSCHRHEANVSFRHRLSFGALRLTEVQASLRLSRHVVCLCHQDQDYVVDRRWRSEGDVSVVAPGVDEVYLASAAAKLDRPRLLFLGSWTARKGTRALAAALPLVLAAIPDARLSVVGAHAPAEVVLEAFPADVRPAVDVAPVGTEQELLAHIQASSVMVMPSLYEGFGMAFLEAMAIGVPVVGTATGGMADLIRSGENGVLVPARDSHALASALLELLTDAKLRTRLGAGARQTARTHTWLRSAHRLNDVYCSLAHHPA